jgi:hypothetical protein
LEHEASRRGSSTREASSRPGDHSMSGRDAVTTSAHRSHAGPGRQGGTTAPRWCPLLRSEASRGPCPARAATRIRTTAK